MAQSIQEKALSLHKKNKGKITTALKNPLETKGDLSWAYTPGVAAVSKYLAENSEKTNEYTWRGNCVAVVSDGSAVLGLGNIGPEGAYPVMEGKCALFKRFAGIDAVPILLSTQDPDQIIATVRAIAPSFGGINLEDIAAPKCFYIEEKLKKSLDIPVIHDDQWGTAVVVLAGLLNASKVSGKKLKNCKIVINGVGAAGASIVKILHAYGCTDIYACDSHGIIYQGRPGITKEKMIIADISNNKKFQGDLSNAVQHADILVGVSKAGSFSDDIIKQMSEKAIVFALANPTPEIMPDEAFAAGAYVVATGRSDFPNQVNNALAFPGIFKGLLTHKIRNATIGHLIRAAEGIASLIENPTEENIIPSVFDSRVVDSIVAAIKK